MTTDRIRELEAIAEECERAADGVGFAHPLYHQFIAVADDFRSKARVLSKVRGEKEIP